MPKLAQITDPQTLRQAAVLLESTVIRQTKEIVRLRAENARLRGQTVDPQMELELLKEQLAAMQQKLYGASSEKRPRSGGGGGQGQGEKKEPQRGHGPRTQPNLPLENVAHTLPEDERTCAFCGGQVEEMKGQVEAYEEITVVGVEYKLVVHERQKYRCSCNAQVVTASGPARLVPGGRYSIDFAVHVAEAKYLDHLPLERQARAMERRGLIVDSQTLWDQIDALADHLRPTYEALLGKILETDVVYADETYWPNHDRGETCRWWSWCVASDEMATYRILPSRSANAAEQVLGGYKGVAMTDGYGAYQALERAGPGMKLAHCWAHVRRKFIEGEDAYPALSREAVEKIGELFAVERQAPRPEPQATPEERASWLELRQRLREETSRSVVLSLRDWALSHRGRVLPRSKMGKAIEYMITLWPGLTLFLTDPRVPLDNNGAERALRGLVVGRKNHYGSRSKRGTEVAALFYTLLETAKLSRVDPAAYLRLAATRAIASPGTITLPSDLP